MKTLLAIMTLAVVTLSASAAQIAWGSDGALYNGTTQMKTANGFTTSAYLVYLGDKNATWDSIDIASFVENPTSAVGTKTANAAGVVSYNKDNYVFAVGDEIPNNAPKTIVDGNSNFGVLFVSTGTGWGDEEKHYFTGAVQTFSTSGSNYSAATETFSNNPSVPSGSSWTAVPEPSVALMGLLGLGMLLKRRRA